MFGIFDKKNGEPRVSMGEALQNNRQKREAAKKQQAEQTYKDVLEAIAQTDAQKTLYATRAQRAIAAVKRAEANHDTVGKRIAYDQLKFAYAVYQYIGKIHDVYRIIQGQLDMQGATEELVATVGKLNAIRIPTQSVNFDKLTDTALRGFRTMDVSGVDNMLQQMLNTSTQTSSISGISDQLMDQLIRGEITLDTPYTAEVTTDTVEPVQTHAAETSTQTAENLNDALSMLNAITSGLRDSHHD
ncbi:MAG: hypothetical protein ACI4MJ_11280 [Aristaeellaceae bacterium]